MRHLMLAAAMLVAATGGPAFAARCKDGQGRLVKCPKPAAGAIKCRDERGKKAKCGLPGTHTVDT